MRCSCGADLAPSQRRCDSCGRRQPLRAGHVIADRYVLLGRLGSGGMGTVFRARDTQLDVDVALKVMAFGDRQRIERFKSEVRLARSIKHPNVCALYEYGEESDGHLQYATMELVEGLNLRELRERTLLDFRRAADLVRQAAEGLQAIHALGLLHRDIKSANLMVTGDGSLRIVDFGIARAERPEPDEPGQTLPGYIVGTPEYMSPERVQQLPVDARSDLYALGIVLYELLVGNVPFRGDSPVEVLNKQIALPPPLDTPEASVIPSPLVPLLASLLAKRPDDRPPDAADVARRLREMRSQLSDTDVVSGQHPAPLSPPVSRGWRLALLGLSIALAIAMAVCPPADAPRQLEAIATSSIPTPPTTPPTGEPPATEPPPTTTPPTTEPPTTTPPTTTPPITTPPTTTPPTTTPPPATPPITEPPIAEPPTTTPPEPAAQPPQSTPTPAETCASTRATATCLSCPEPNYPPVCERLRMEAELEVALNVDATGRVTGVEILHAQGDECSGAFAKAVERTTLEWRFEPPVVGGIACETRVEKMMKFSLPP